MKTLDAMQKKQDYLICIDSDGTAMDTMDIKHIKCFGPCMVEIWELEPWKNEILERWNEINLYTMTRGINRFKGLKIALEEINKTYKEIDGLSELISWVEQTSELSNGSLEKQLDMNPNNTMLKKTLQWSNLVNQKVASLPQEDKQPFEGVKEALIKAHENVDIAIVSSANKDAVLEEWTVHQLIPYVDVVLAQNIGTKAFCIQELLKLGYSKEKVLMIGDAPADAKAAMKNGILFYPICVNREKESWKMFIQSGLNHLLEDNYVGAYQEEQLNLFYENLK